MRCVASLTVVEVFDERRNTDLHRAVVAGGQTRWEVTSQVGCWYPFSMTSNDYYMLA